MNVTPLSLQQPVRPWSAPAPAPPGQAPQDPVDERTPLARFLSDLPEYPRGAVIGAATLSPPLVGGMVGGLPGAVLGTAAAFGFQYGIDKDARRSVGAVLWPGILGLLMTSSSAAPSPLRIGLVVGMGAAMGCLAVWRGKVEEKLQGN